MNKALLLIICDFLLISLLALARFDEPLDEELKQEPEQVVETMDPQEDLSDILKASLEEERLARESLSDELTRAQDELRKRQEEMKRQEEELKQSQARLDAEAQERARLAVERAALEAKLQASLTNVAEIKREADATRAQLDQVAAREAAAARDKTLLAKQLEDARKGRSELEAELSRARSDVAVSQQVLDELQDDLKKQVAFAGQLQQNMVALEKDHEVIKGEKQQLAGQLQTAQVETRIRQEQVETMKEEVAVVRTEKERLEERTTTLAGSVSTLAESSQELTKEIRDQKTQNANSLFLQLSTNQIQTAFMAERPGLLGKTVVKQAAQQTILVSLGERVFAIYHVEDTPFSLDPFPPEWSKFSGTLGRGAVLFSITQLQFLDGDPRIAVVPIGRPQAEQLGSKIYPVSTEPSKFQEAVLVGAKDGYYGECSFQIDPRTPNYVRMQRERFSFFSGRFVPSRGDLVLSKTGEVLGVMANKEYCYLLTNMESRRAIRTGPARPAPTLLQMYQQVMKLPPQLQ